MAARGDNSSYVYRGEYGERIPRGATYITVAEIVHSSVQTQSKGIKVVMPGVKTAQHAAFSECEALREVECGKLEVVEGRVFASCKSLRSINLPSAETVEWEAFSECTALKKVKFGSKLQEIEKLAFYRCRSLERITIPLKKNGIITRNNTFSWCRKLRHVDLVEGAVLDETVDALNVEDWKNDMNEAIRSSKEILLNRPAGYDGWDDGEWKAKAIRSWIRSVLGKIVRYKANHRRVLNEASSSLQLVLPEDIGRRKRRAVMTKVTTRGGIKWEEERNVAGAMITSIGPRMGEMGWTLSVAAYD
eukprot:scaffold2832_cov132-Skeletonema_dohrnii-CCMP3373.AAC.3